MATNPAVREDRAARLHFETTRWSLVERARSNENHDEALGDLLERLWGPVYAWLRRSGRREDEARDLAQGFMADVVLGRDLLRNADPARGRLRSLVLASLKRYLIDQHRRVTVRPDLRANAASLAAVEERAASTYRGDDADTLFERRWSAAVLDAALRRVRDRLVAAERETHWRAFELRVLLPATTGRATPSTLDVAAACGFRTPALAAAAVQSVRKKTLATLREVIGETTSPESIEEEYQRLLRLLG